MYIRWRWDGESEFYWAIDDIGVYDVDPSAFFIPQHELRITDFYAIAPNAMTPFSLVEPFTFLADIKNDGLTNQNNVDLDIRIRHTGDDQEVYADNINIEEIPSNFLAENNLLPGSGFSPPKVGYYEATYSVSADSLDERPDNNAKTFDFEVTTNTFAKEDGILSYTIPLDVWLPGANKSWGWGNYFYCPNGLGYKAKSITFSIQGNLGNLAEEVVLLRLYQWRDSNEDGDCQEDERFLMETTKYKITGFEQRGKFIEVLLNDGLGVALDDDAEYVVMVEFEAPNDDDDLEIAYNNNFNYGGQYLRSDLDDKLRHGSFIWIGNPDSTTFLSYGFGFSPMPCVRLNIDLDNSISPQLPTDQNKLALFPNPVNTQITANIQLQHTAQQAQINILNSAGQIVVQQLQQAPLKKEILTLPTASLPTGIYFFQVQTEQGFLTKRFAIQR